MAIGSIKDTDILTDTVPFGTMEFSREQGHRITSLDDGMLDILRYREAYADELSICMQSIYSVIAAKDHAWFADIAADPSDTPKNAPLKIDLVRFDGNLISCLFWLRTGGETVRASFIEITSWLRKERTEETERFVRVLSEVYTDIFEFDYTTHTVKAVYSKRSAMLRWIKDIPMQMEEATKKWILHKVPQEDIGKLQDFWAEDPSKRIPPQKDNTSSDKKQPSKDQLKLHYHVMSSDGTLWRYLGVFVPGSSGTWLFCCRKDPEYSEAITEPYNGPKVKIRTFGYFDVFIGDTPVAFRNEKSKELLALLVDRKGGYVTAEEAISFLWEDSPADSLTLSRYRKVALRLKRTLEEYGISEIIESVNGKRRIVTDRVQCDLYEYLSGKDGSAGLFKGSYLTNYSWAENTLAELLQSSGAL